MGLSSLAARGVGNEGEGISALSSPNIAASRASISALLIDPAPARVDDVLWSGVTLMMDDSRLRRELIGWLRVQSVRSRAGMQSPHEKGRETVTDRSTLTSEQRARR
ncbi:MAG: hypothetical protein EOP32_40275 [Rhodococcus sp. (in: high G+C Gram-positive bacteria)]|nr:MAG: hypothetical protein EOP32_40275 [Rhodococcus sp. (in: high G+C Gram-positive bacteria)]